MGFWLLMMAATATFAPLKQYEGTWTVVSAHTMAGDGRPDTVVNHCSEGTAFYTCEQVVNGKPLALVVFTATDDPTKFHTQPVLPSGRAVGLSDLTIAGAMATRGSGEEISHFELGVTDLPVRAAHAQDFGGSEDFLVLVDGLRGAFDDPIRLDAVVVLGNIRDVGCQDVRFA